MTIRAATLVACLSALLGPAAEATAQPLPDSAEQIEWALSAGPDHVSEGAGVYVLGPNGYSLARESTNGFTCIVERWLADDPWAPVCYDTIGSQSTLEAVIYLEGLRASGMADEQSLERVEEGYASGRLTAPAGIGVAYMLSTRSPAPPHVMYYAPYATNAEFVGAEGSDRGSLPFIYDEGSARAYIVQLVVGSGG